MRRLKVYAILLLLLLGSTSFAQERGAFVSGGIGAKAMGMGDAIVSVVSDCSALYWNVAGLAENRLGNIILGNQDLYGIGVGYNQIATSIPLGKFGVAGLSYERTDFSNAVDFGYFEEQIGAGIAREFTIKSYGHKIKLGLGFNLYRSHLDSLAAKAQTTGGGLSFGLLLPVGKRIKIGVSLRDIANSLNSQREFEEELESKTEKMPASLTVGTSYQFNENFLVALDVVNFSQLHLGGEYRLGDHAFLRGGFKETNLTAGLGVKIGKLKIDYSYSPTFLGNNQRITLGMDF